MGKQQSNNFKFEYLSRGSSYTSTIDYRRFVTLDYNLETYVGIVGVGIIDGWTIDIVSGTTIKILPGTGIINGYAVESNYDYKQRSNMVLGEREIEEIHDTTTVYPYLSDAQRTQYITIIQDYDPSFIPPEQIENCFVKVVIPYQIVLADNTDSYIVAKLPSGALPYPEALDYPTSSIKRPVDSDYLSYDEFKAAMDAYTSQIELIHSYQWRSNPLNRFTAVEFDVQGSFGSYTDRVLLGKVTTKNGEIIKIDVSKVENLKNMESAIKAAAKLVIPGHKHGGEKYFDPPKIKLETDIRKIYIRSYDATSNVAIFDVPEPSYTNISNGHKHSYKVDSSNNGFTIETIGSGEMHFHKIISGVVQTQEVSYLTVEDHVHTILDVDVVGGWSSDSSFLVYVNDSLFGDNTSSSIESDSLNKTLKLFGAIGAEYKTYSSTFTFSYGGNNIPFSFSSKEYSVLNFMSNMIKAFNEKYKFSTVSTNDDGTLNVSENPFLFTGDTTTVLSGFSELYDQSLIAQYALKNIGDGFVFTPKAAQNITVVLTKTDTSSTDIYNAKIEILGNTEVTGVLNLDNILFVNANKIQTGELEVARIPFISHIGRMKESMEPFKYPLISTNAVEYSVMPSITTNELSHYHKLFLNKDNSGVTTQTFVNNQPVYYGTGQTGQVYFIDHIHGVPQGVVAEANSSGLTSWINDINSTNSTSSSHSHQIIYPSTGDVNIVYSIIEVSDGTLFAGTSSGLIAIAGDEAYLYVVNGVPFYLLGNNLWDLLLEAKRLYEIAENIPLLVTEDIYLQQTVLAKSELLAHGDSYMLFGAIVGTSGQDKVMIKRLEYFPIPNFKYVSEKTSAAPDETVVGIKMVNETTGEIIDPNQPISDSANTSDVITTVFIVEKNLNGIPVWSMDIEEKGSDEMIIAVGASSFAVNTNLQEDFYKSWSTPKKPLFSGSFKKVFADSNKDIWAVTDSGLLVSRSVFNGETINTVSQPGLDPNIYDITEGSTGTIFCACIGGIYKTVDMGYSWTNSFDDPNGCLQVLRDYKKDKTDNLTGHYHEINVNRVGNGTSGISIGSGPSHTHIISSWVIETTYSHTHSIITTLYTVTKERSIYKSLDDGLTWNILAELPSGEYGEIIAFNGLVAINKNDGLYLLNDNSWTKVLNEIVYSFGLRYDMDEVLMGCCNVIYSTSDFLTFSVEMELSGNPNVSLYINEELIKFKNAYNNFNNSFTFKDLTYTTDQAYSLVDFNKWIAKRGGWNINSKYDIYIDDKMVVSTKKNINNMDLYGYKFKVVPADGTIDFSAETTGALEVSIYDNSLIVNNTEDFSIGDKIFVRCETVLTPADLQKENAGTTFDALKNYQERAVELKNMFMYATIDGISPNSTGVDADGKTYSIPGQLILLERVDRKIELPFNVKKIANVESSTVIKINIYESPLENSGVFYHEEIEDKLSAKSDGRPYLFNNSFLSNLLQLTQAVRYVYPEINSEFKNSKFYDFKYSWDILDPNYIGNEIDLFNCNVYNFSIFSNTFYTLGAKKINRVIFGIGTGVFSNTIIIGTDIGIFWSKIEDGLEGNWFHIKAMSMPIYDIIIFGNKLFACTEDGTYTTDDMDTWTLQINPSIFFPSSKTAFRWKGRETVSIGAHTATFTNGYGSDSNVGSIVSTTPIYSNLISERKIKIDDSGDIDGIYTIKDVTSTNHIITYELFPITSSETHAGTTIKMGSWWEYLDGEISSNNPNLTNTLMIGGKNKIAFCTNSYSCTWSESFIPENVDNFTVSSLCPIDNGTALASTISLSNANITNFLLKNSGIGDSWEVFKAFEEIKGTVISSSATDFSHTKLKVKYDNDISDIYIDGNLVRKNISLFVLGNTTAIYSGKVIWNEYRKEHSIYVAGRDLASVLVGSNLSNVVFVIYPEKINDITQISNGAILYGTDIGAFSDLKSFSGVPMFKGTVMGIGNSGIVSEIDTTGTIQSVSSSTSGNVQFSVSVNNNIPINSLTDSIIYITDLIDVESYTILKNGSRLVNGEILVEVDLVYTDSVAEYKNKRVTISNKSFSRIYISLNFGMTLGQYAGGKIYIISNESNLGKSYDIVNNTQFYLDVTPAIVPSSTIEFGNAQTDDLRERQSISIIDATGRMDLYVQYDWDVEQNVLAKMNVSFISTSSSSAADIDGITIYSNDINKITLNPMESLGIVIPPLAFNIGDRFSAYGFVFSPINRFNNKLTSIVSGHYHSVETLGQDIYGNIGSFSNVGTSFVDINIIDVAGFDNPMIQTRDDLFRGAKIIFYNLGNKMYWYESEVYSHTNSSIRVYIQDVNKWNFIASSTDKVSVGWGWVMETSDYGYTNSVYYKDFVFLKNIVSSDIIAGSTTIFVDSTVGMVNGDKIKINDENLKSEVNYISNIISSTSLELVNPTNQYFYKSNSPFIEVIRDNFTNNHIHQIRNNQVETIYVSDYLERGYNSTHSHETMPFISSVSKIIERNNEIIAIGSSENIFISYNSGEDWKALVNLNKSLDRNDSISGIIDINIDSNNKLVAGSDNGYMFTEENNTLVVPLEKP